MQAEERNVLRYFGWDEHSLMCHHELANAGPLQSNQGHCYGRYAARQHAGR